MTARSRTFARYLLLFSAIIIVCSALATAGPAQASNPPATWAAWHVKVDFAQNTPRIIYTAYVGTDSPQPAVLGERVSDITQDCTIVGTLNYFQGRAIFDGNSYIECDLPSWRAEIAQLAPYLRVAQEAECICQAGGAPLWAAADVRLAPGMRQNPVFAAPSTAMEFALPTIGGGQMEMEMFIDGNSYTSPSGNKQPALNQFLMGMYGPGIVAAADHFAWLDFMPDASWKTFFETDVVGTRMGYWEGSSSANWFETASDYRVKTDVQTLYIGYNPVTNEYLHGVLKAGEFDPGCRAY